MTFENFIEKLKIRLTKPLPGPDAQVRMSPAGRRIVPTAETLANAKKSAVCILLYPNEEGKIFFPLMIRPTYPGVHSGQISFPGGRVEKEDNSYIDTALRETEEEIGVSRYEIQVLANMSQMYIPPSNFYVQPILAFLKEKPKFTPDPVEVAEIVEVDLLSILDKNIIKSKDLKMYGGVMKDIRYYDIQNKMVWGATAVMLSELLEMVVEVLES